MTSDRPRRLPPFFEWVALDTVDSTNEEVKRRARAGAQHGLLVTAVTQSQGRGRQSRTWVSTPGNLHASFLLRPQVPTARAAELSFLAAVAAAETVAAFAGSEGRVRC